MIPLAVPGLPRAASLPLLTTFVLALVSCGRSAPPAADQAPASTAGPAAPRAPLPISIPPQAAAGSNSDGEWWMAARDYANTRYSPLAEITSSNVGRLKVAWTFSTGVTAGHEAPPLVVGDTMYVVTPYPNFVFALDLSRPGAPMKWRFDPMGPGAARGVACCDVVNRGGVYWNGSFIFNTLDGRTIALDAATGAPRWSTTLADINRGETVTMAPIVAHDKVIVGNSGGEFGVRG